MAENRVKVVIEADSAGAITSLGQFVQALGRTGATAKLSDAELARLADRFRDKLSADQAAAALDLAQKQIARIGTAAGLSQQELAHFSRQLGVVPAQTNATGNALGNIATGATEAGASLGGLAAKIGVAVAAYLSLKEVLSFVSDSIQSAARYETLGIVLAQVGKNAGYTKDEMLGFAEGVRQSGISMVASREALAKMAQAQLDLSKASDLARVAQDAAVISGNNSSEAFERIVQGIANGQTVLLRHQGILVDLDDAYKKYAAQLGISKDDLTETEKRQAAMNAVLEAGARSAGAYEAAMMTAGKQLTSFQRYLDDIKTTLGEAFLDSFTSSVFNAADAMKQFQAALAEPEAQAAIASLANAISSMINWVTSHVPAAISVFSKFLSVVGGAIDMVQHYRDALPEMFGVFGTGAAKVIDLFTSTGPEKIAKMTASIEAAKQQFNEMEDGAEKLKLGETIQRQADALEKFKNAAKNAHSISNMITPTAEERQAVEDYWAKHNKGVREYKQNVEKYISIGNDEKNSKFLPIDQQRTQAFADYDKKIKGIAVAWKEAYNKGQWEDVLALNKSATVAVGQYTDKLDKLDREANKGSKSAANAATAAARYGEQTGAYLLQAQNQYDQLVAQFAGDSLGAKLAAIDKRYNAAAASIRKSMIGAKGATDDAQAALEQLEKNRALEKQIAAADAWKKSMQEAANMLQELGRLSGDPTASYGATMTTAQVWEADQKKRINAIQDEAERTKQLAELQEAMNLKEVEARKQAYQDLSAVSSQYWEAERTSLEQHLAVAKQNSTDETACKIYEAEQWDAYNKALLEHQEKYAGTAAETFAAKWALAFGTYKSEATKAKEAWEQTAQAAIDAANSVVDGIAGGVGDMVRSFGDGTASIESLFQNLRSRILDMFASMLEEMVKRWLTDFVGRIGSGEGLGNLFGSSTSSGGGTFWSSGGMAQSTGINMSGLSTLGQMFGKESADAITSALPVTTDGLTVALSDVPDIGKSIAKSLDTYGSVWDASSSRWASDNYKSWDAGTFSKAIAKGTSSGWADALDGIGAGTGLGTVLASALGADSTTGAIASGVGSAVGAAIGSIIPGVGTLLGGIIGGAGGGLLGSLFGGQDTKTEKTGSGYRIAINAGTLNMSGVDFYKATTGSSVSHYTVDTGMVDPDVAKRVNDQLKETAENLHDFAKTLGFATGDLLDMLSMPDMTITDGQLDSYIRNTGNVMAFQALDSAGLRGGFDYVAERYEAYEDEFKRLADAYQTVGGYTEAYGYDLEKVAGITADSIASIRQVNTETAQGTSQALLSMAASMGATSDQLAELTATANDGSQALDVTDAQLSKILQADYASKLEDAVGGADAFQTLMENLVKNTLDSVEAYQEQASYYTDKANASIQELGQAGVTIDNFWQQFDAAMHGAISVDDFEQWADAAGWVNALNTISDALDDWADTVAQAYQNLDVRALKAQGLDYQAELTEMLAAAEQELTQAREAGYDAAFLSRLAEVQALEYAAKVAQHAEDYAKELRDAQKRYATAIDDSSALIQITIAENAAELQELAKTYNWSPGSAEEELFTTLQQAQWAEVIAQIEDTADAVIKATAAMQRDLAARQATIAGYDEEAQALQMVAGYADELAQAYADGIAPDLIAELMQTQIDELAKYWSDTIDGMQSDLADLYAKQHDLLDMLAGNTQSAMQELEGLFVRYQAGETDLADDIVDQLQSIANAIDDMVTDIYKTIYDIRTGDDYTTDTANVVASNALAYYQEQLAAAASGDTEAMANISGYATSYLSAVKAATADESVYNAARDYVTRTLTGLASGTTGASTTLTGIATTVTGDQISAAETQLHHAQVDALESQYETLYAQAVAAFQGSRYGDLVAAMATTGLGWSDGITQLLMSDYWEGGTRSQRAADAILAGVGGMNAERFAQWFVTNGYGTGSGYVDWDAALSQWVERSQTVWPGVAALPDDVMGTYDQAQQAYQAWQALKSQYGFELGGVIASSSSSGDNTLVWANGGERVLTPGQNQAFEELVYGRGGDGLAAELIARVERLADAVDNSRRANTEENRAINRRLTNIQGQVDDWALNGSLQVGVKGTVTTQEVVA